MRILVFGANGMLGHVVSKYLSLYNDNILLKADKSEILPLDYKIDVTEKDKVEALILETEPDVVINCIGILNQFAEDNPDIAILLNSYFPHVLDKLSRKYNFKFIHISTDCVFNGKRGGYVENDFRDGTGFYSQTKALGEIINNRNLTFRTSIIGPELKNEGIGLFNWVMMQNGLIKGYTNAFWSGVTTLHLAQAIMEAINNDLIGLYHLTNSTKISKYELLFLIKNIFEKNNIEIDAFDNYHSDKSLINTRTDFPYKIPDYETMLIELKEFIQKNRVIYKRYLK